MHRVYFEEQETKLSVSHRNALTFILCEVKLCARIAFGTNTMQSLLPPAYCDDLLDSSQDHVRFKDISMLLLTRGSRTKMRQFKCPNEEHWGNSKWKAQALQVTASNTSSRSKRKMGDKQKTYTCLNIRKLLRCDQSDIAPLIEGWITNDAASDFMEVANVLIHRIINGAVSEEMTHQRPDVTEDKEGKIAELNAIIDAQSNRVRELKSASLSSSLSTMSTDTTGGGPVEKEVIIDEVNELLRLKAEFKTITGLEYKPGIHT